MVVKNLRQTLQERVQSQNGAQGKKPSPQEERAQKARLQELEEVGQYLRARRLHIVGLNFCTLLKMQLSSASSLDACRTIQCRRQYDTGRTRTIIS